MALKSTIYKAELNISDLDRHYYHEHSLTLALHPSETEERLMMRIVAFVAHASERLAFGRGISTDDEADLWLKDDTGSVELWIDVGQPDERLLRKACNVAARVVVLTYAQSADIWWQQNRRKLELLDNLSVLHLPKEAKPALLALVSRGMRLQCTVQDGVIWLTDANQSAQIDFVRWKDIRENVR